MKKKKWNSLENAMRKIAQTPVDPALFEFSLGLFCSAASGEMHGSHIPRPDSNFPGIYLTDIPINRGILAVMRETEHLSQADRMALTFRLMHFGEAMAAAREDDRFATHLLPDEDEDGAVMVSGSFQKAYAQCQFLATKKTLRVDLDSLLSCISAVEQ